MEGKLGGPKRLVAGLPPTSSSFFFSAGLGMAAVAAGSAALGSADLESQGETTFLEASGTTVGDSFMKSEAPALGGVAGTGAVFGTVLVSLAELVAENAFQELLLPELGGTKAAGAAAGLPSAGLLSFLSASFLSLVGLPNENFGTGAGTLGNSTCLPKANLRGGAVVAAGTAGVLPKEKAGGAAEAV